MFEHLAFGLEIGGLGLSVIGFGLMSAEWWIAAQEASDGARKELAGKHHVPPKMVKGAYSDLTELKARLISHPKDARHEAVQLSIGDVIRIIQLAEIGAIQSSSREMAQDRSAREAVKANAKRHRLFALGATTTLIGFVAQFAAQVWPIVVL